MRSLWLCDINYNYWDKSLNKQIISLITLLHTGVQIFPITSQFNIHYDKSDIHMSSVPSFFVVQAGWVHLGCIIVDDDLKTSQEVSMLFIRIITSMQVNHTLSRNNVITYYHIIMRN